HRSERVIAPDCVAIRQRHEFGVADLRLVLDLARGLYSLGRNVGKILLDRLFSHQQLLELLEGARNAVDHRDEIFARRHFGARFVALNGSIRNNLGRCKFAGRARLDFALRLDRRRNDSVVNAGTLWGFTPALFANATALALEAAERLFQRQDSVSWLAAILTHCSTAVLVELSASERHRGASLLVAGICAL